MKWVDDGPNVRRPYQLLEIYVWRLRWLLVLVGLGFLLVARPIGPARWLPFVAVVGAILHNCFRGWLITHGTLAQLRRLGALLFALDVLILCIGLWPVFRPTRPLAELLLLVIPLETLPRLRLARGSLPALGMAGATALVVTYELLALRVRGERLPDAWWIVFYMLIGFCGTLFLIAQERTGRIDEALD